VPHLRDGLIVAKVGHFCGSENPDTLNSPMPPWLERSPTKLVRPKIKLKKVAYFQPPINRCFQTSIHHAITTISPANYHQEIPTISPTPFKNTSKTAKKSRSALRHFFLQNRQKMGPSKHPSEDPYRE
jgi:hypothetical protein